MEKIKWGIIGPGSIANNFADGLKGSYSGQLVSIASKNDDRRKNFGDKYDIHPDFRFDNYDDIINSEHIDAIYISTPHTLHAEWTIKAAGKGKHVLCEKPGAVNLNEGKKIIEAVKGLMDWGKNLIFGQQEKDLNEAIKTEDSGIGGTFAAADQQIKDNKFFTEFSDKTDLLTVDSPIFMKEEKKKQPDTAPEIGEHTRHILEELDYNETEIDKLESKKIIRT